MIFRLALFSVSALAGMAFKWLQMPIPWLLGALAVALFVKARVDETAEWPRLYRSAGLIVVGYSVGRYLTLDALNGISGQLPGMLAATLSSIIVALLIACLTARQEGLDLQSCVMGIMPGGFTQMAVMCDEDGRADKNIVVLMQSLRLMSVIAAVPFLAIHVLDGPDHSSPEALELAGTAALEPQDLAVGRHPGDEHVAMQARAGAGC